jgi:hypothetical protein
MVLMDQSAQNVAASDLRAGLRPRVQAGMGRLKIEAPMRPGPVVVLDVGGEHALQVTPAEDEDVVEALPTNGAYPALRERVRLRRADGRLHDGQSFCSEDLVEASGELGVSISDEDVLVLEASGDREVPRLLSDPRPSRADWSNPEGVANLDQRPDHGVCIIARCSSPSAISFFVRCSGSDRMA